MLQMAAKSDCVKCKTEELRYYILSAIRSSSMSDNPFNKDSAFRLFIRDNHSFKVLYRNAAFVRQEPDTAKVMSVQKIRSCPPAKDKTLMRGFTKPPSFRKSASAP